MQQITLVMLSQRIPLVKEHRSARYYDYSVIRTDKIRKNVAANYNAQHYLVAITENYHEYSYTYAHNPQVFPQVTN